MSYTEIIIWRAKQLVKQTRYGLYEIIQARCASERVELRETHSPLRFLKLRVFKDWWSFPWQLICESRNFKLNQIVAFRSAKVCQTLLSRSKRYFRGAKGDNDATSNLRFEPVLLANSKSCRDSWTVCFSSPQSGDPVPVFHANQLHELLCAAQFSRTPAINRFVRPNPKPSLDLPPESASWQYTARIERARVIATYKLLASTRYPAPTN